MKAEITQHDSGILEVKIGKRLYVFTDIEIKRAKRRGDSVILNRLGERYGKPTS